MDSNRIFRNIEDKIFARGSKKTAKAYISGLRLFCGYFYGKEHPKHISSKEIVTFLAWVRQFRGDSMARTCYWAVRFLYVEIEEQRNKFDGIKPIHIKSKPRTPLSKEYIVNKIKGIENIRDKAMMWVLFTSGVRCSELASIEQENLDWSNMLIKVVGKGNKQRFVQFPLNVQEVVRKHLDLQKPSKYLFAGEKSGNFISPSTVLDKVHQYLDSTTHVIRHSFATQLKRMGVDISDISLLLGHARLDTTRIYLHNDIEDIKKIPNTMQNVAA